MIRYANVGLRRRVLSENLVPFWPCLWARVFLLLGRYTYDARSAPLEEPLQRLHAKQEASRHFVSS